MAEKKEAADQGKEEEKESLMEKVAILDFDMLCATVAMQSQKGKWDRLNADENVDEEDILVYGNEGGGGGVLRMWEGELVYDCFDDRRIALQSACCPCYRFGKNMRLAGFGSCFLQDSDSCFDDCVYHLICPCCSLCQESRTLEINVQDGIWHGRGDTICIGSYSEGGKAFFEPSPPPIMSRQSPEQHSISKATNESSHSWAAEVGQTSPLV